MASNKPPMLVNQRYLLDEQIGTGGMGAVFRVTDRLNGMDVALKQVTIPPDQLMYSSRSSETDLNLSLAQEFKTMASLRHPNIISVLDYGFNVEGQPYFTMDLLENAQTLVEAGCDQPLEEQVDLLVQTLLALAYLHRRGVLHRDLKPGNVMVVNDQVKLLDFGVSVITARSTANVNASSGGTLAYMAPELFRGEPASHGSDFYAVGVMAFELFAGRFPYDLDNIALMLNQIVSLPVDMSPLHQGAPLVAVLEKLLAKTREARYRTANEVIQALCEAADHPMPPETTEIRESFLQAAKFVGREAEMAQLEEVLTEAITGRGSTWLVAGESGVGKSRLCNELRTLALVEGAQVLYGQSISEGGSPYSLWREALRWLVLGADLPNEQASVLKALVPDIGELLGKEVPDAPPLDPQAEQQRLLRTTTSVFKRQTQPVLVILEDLQWTGSTSLKLLNWLKTYLVDASVLFLGNYRDDERPDLPDELPGVNLLKLER